MSGSQRLQRYASDLGVAGLEQLGHYRYTDAQEGLPTHIHEGCAEICLLASGRQRYRLNGQVFQLSGGQQLVTLPGEPHDTGGAPEERGSLYWLVVRLDPLPCWLHLHPEAAAPVQSALRQIPIRHFAARPSAERAIQGAVQLLHTGAATLERVEGAMLLVQFLLDTVAAANESAARTSPVVERARRFVLDNLDRPLTVPEIAAAAGCSVSYLHTVFHHKVGMPPGEFQLRARLRKAQTLLTTTELSAGDIGQQVGFSTSQHFSTIFRRYTRTTPTAYRRAR